jgi:hypothetical protein
LNSLLVDGRRFVATRAGLGRGARRLGRLLDFKDIAA